MKLVLCDPHTMFMDALNAGLARRGHLVVANSDDADELVELVTHHEPDVCVIDLNPDNGSLLETAARIREGAPGVRVVLLTGEAGEDVWMAFETGLVDGVVNKACDITVLNRAIERVMAGERVLERFTRPPVNRSGTPGLTRLSSRERAVVSLLVSGASTEEMAVELGVSTQTVRTHVQSVLRKFCVNSRSRAVSIAVDLGAVTIDASEVDGWPVVADREVLMRGAVWERPVDVLLVDDHRVFAEALASRLQAEQGIEHIDIACSLSEARAYIHRSCPDLIMLDYQLDDEAGTDLLADLDGLPDRPNVLMLSGHDRAQLAVQAFEAGAHGWVSKTAPFETLMFAAAEVAHGRMYLARASLKPVLHYLLQQSTSQSEPSFVDDLSARQTEVLRCVVSGMSRAECAQRLNLSVHTVRTHVQQLLKRAEVHSTLALASRARGLGVRGIDDPVVPLGMAR